MKKICIITGSRAEWGLFYPLAGEIKRTQKDLNLQLVATGMHLLPEYGLTYKDIEVDGFSIDRKVEMLFSGDTTGASMARSVGTGIIGLTDTLEDLDPDIVILLGDRFETFSAAVAAFMLKIPIAHIHGGELTEGAIDDVLRHSITKMSNLHFVSTEVYRKRVIQMGEEPDRVFNVGAIGLDNIKRMKPISRETLEEELGFKFAKHNYLVTFHPATLEKKDPKGQFKALLEALNGTKDTKMIFTKANADAGGAAINNMIDEYVAQNINKSVAISSMGQARYLSTMRLVNAVIGNSSSGIIEAPSFNIGTINIGDRQKGRIRAGSVIDCPPTREGIEHAIDELYTDTFQEKLKNNVSPYGDGNAARRITDVIKAHDLDSILKKKFHDIIPEGKAR